MNAIRSPLLAQTTIDSPLGPLLLAATAQGLAGAWFTDQAHHPGALDAPEDPDNAFIQQAAEELCAYWRDATGSRFGVKMDPQGTDFQRAVWQALLEIPAGRSSTYATLATQIHKPLAVRAVGAAVGRNPLSVIIPCHRVLGSDGSLTGYAGGLERKVDLLQREGRWPIQPRTAAPTRSTKPHPQEAIAA
ncbi:MAG TPA: methylated-DNA--[protein]-cysteine S-methyltransferase [Ideonella sp.]|uniref:methylated-DNA--[protein]-cysteine S-methyltransferase n=1 Tax=Ideonella sp. TaxID=1929293 RepID=UPI002E3411B6|nr:methylated-DNA--[protein]-cysteine S-methyltransferase [Ideonella sp.]HEX5686519.1 methylated-DNA--[protein]-cysteine S-methyltransferase [Ideonella sp.]